MGLQITDQLLADQYAKCGRTPPAHRTSGVALPSAAVEPVKKMQAVRPYRMTLTERRYSVILERMVDAGEIKRFAYEAVTLVVIDVQGIRRRFIPDFSVWNTDGSLWFLEIKGGHIWEDAKLKLLMAAQAYPEHRFVMRQWLKDEGWVTLYDLNGSEHVHERNEDARL